MTNSQSSSEPVVITGIGLITSVGQSRESVWRAIRHGRSGVRSLCGLRGIPDGLLIGAPVDIEDGVPGRLKTLPLCERAAAEAMDNAGIDLADVDLNRFGCTINGHMGDSRSVDEQLGLLVPGDPSRELWWRQWLPNTACSLVANKYKLAGPRMCHSTACASSLIGILSAVRSIHDGRCDIVLAGGGDAIDPLFAAGFHRMRVLANDKDPKRACRPFDRNRKGFVLGEGAAIFILERLGHALQRGARIYAEVAAGKMLAEAHHVTGLDDQSDALAYLISNTLKQARLTPNDIGYINAHGTATQQNDLVEMRGIRRSFGPAVDEVCVSATKSMVGHVINAAGGVELAITALALRDGFAPPTLNLTDPDPECTFDCLPFKGRSSRFQHALKLSLAFGGHLVALALSRWNDAATGFSYPVASRAA